MKQRIEFRQGIFAMFFLCSLGLAPERVGALEVKGPDVVCVDETKDFTTDVSDPEWISSDLSKATVTQMGAVTGKSPSQTVGDVSIIATNKVLCVGASKAITIPKVESISVVDGATQTNVTGIKNWAAVKGSGDVIVEVTLSPNTDAAAVGVTWTGGDPVAGKPRQRKVSKASSAKTTVKATCGTSSADLDVWIIYGTVTIETAGTTPTNAVQFGASYDGTENLGAQSYNRGTAAVGKVIPIAQLTPAGVHEVLKSGWGFKRQRWSHDFIDEAPDPVFFDTAWTGDTSAPGFQNLTPDADDKIYDRDAPNVARAGAKKCYETYNNFRQWIEWNSDVASKQFSDGSKWHWNGKWQKNGVPEEIILKEVGGGHIILPGVADGCKHEKKTKP